MKITFYHLETDDISININAVLEDGKLSLDGYDYGKRVEELRGMSDEYEYHLSLDEENAAKLFALLGVADGTDKQKLSALKVKFGKNGHVSEVSDYCEENGIKTSFFSWP